MNRAELEQYLLETYQAERDYPWIKYPEFAVFRRANQKWFAVVMNVSRSKLGLESDEMVAIVNLKCSPNLIGALRREPGLFPAYHMNKEHWITAALDGSVPDEQLKMLVDMSFEATAPKTRKTRPV